LQPESHSRLSEAGEKGPKANRENSSGQCRSSETGHQPICDASSPQDTPRGQIDHLAGCERVIASARSGSCSNGRAGACWSFFAPSPPVAVATPHPTCADSCAPELLWPHRSAQTVLRCCGIEEQ